MIVFLFVQLLMILAVAFLALKNCRRTEDVAMWHSRQLNLLQSDLGKLVADLEAHKTLADVRIKNLTGEWLKDIRSVNSRLAQHAAAINSIRPEAD